MKSIIYDLTALFGMASVIYGVFIINVPAAFIIGGLMVIGLSILSAKNYKAIK